MKMKGNPITIVLAEDDEDDYLLMMDALREARVANDIQWVKDGEELINYLLHQGPFQDLKKSSRPGLILLDLNMPKKDDREVLQEIKSNPKLRKIPIVVLTTSKSEEDIIRSYDLGVNSIIKKPVSFDEFVEAIKIMGKYWLEIAELPIQSSVK